LQVFPLAQRAAKEPRASLGMMPGRFLIVRDLCFLIGLVAEE
jgi:hypothetical protein